MFEPNQLCGLLLNDCGILLNPFNSNWTIYLPPQLDSKKQFKKFNFIKNKKPLTVLQLSDLHYDLQYEAGSEAKCSFPVCCRNDSKHKNKVLKQPAGYWGTQSNCDIPYRTIVNMLQHINKTHNV